MSKPPKSNSPIPVLNSGNRSAPSSTTKQSLPDSRPITSVTPNKSLSASASKPATSNAFTSPIPPTRASQPSGKAWTSGNMNKEGITESIGVRLARQIRDKVALEELGPEVRRPGSEIDEDMRKTERQRREAAIERVRTLANRIASLPESALNDSLLELCCKYMLF